VDLSSVEESMWFGVVMVMVQPSMYQNIHSPVRTWWLFLTHQQFFPRGWRNVDPEPRVRGGGPAEGPKKKSDPRHFDFDGQLRYFG